MDRSIASEVKKFLYFMMFLFIVSFLINVVDWGFLSSSKTIYSVGRNDNGKYFTIEALTYKVNKSAQTVIQLKDGYISDSFDDCAVVNRLNWKCYSDINYRMVRGHLYLTNKDGTDFWEGWDIAYVSKARYRWISFWEFFENF